MCRRASTRRVVTLGAEGLGTNEGRAETVGLREEATAYRTDRRSGREREQSDGEGVRQHRAAVTEPEIGRSRSGYRRRQLSRDE